MTSSDTNQHALPTRLEIEDLCTKFEAEWSAANQVSLIDETIRNVKSELRDDLLTELVAIEFEFLERCEQKPDKTIYLERFPQHQSAVNNGVALWASESRPALRRLGEVPDQFGDYQLIRELGRGGTGVVYEAIQDGLTRRVALKALLLYPLSFPKQGIRFEQEAQAAARLDHENIVTVYDSGECDGVLYYAMQLVDGNTLRTVIDEAASESSTSVSLTPEFAADIIQQAARGLGYAHNNNVLHRDVKPSNLLLDKDQHVYVVDFGLAKLKDDDADLTTTGDVVGTLRYLAPEAFDGSRDERADVYGLGLTLYELLTQQPAFQETDRTQLMKQIDQGGVRFPADAKTSIPRDLQTITLKALARDPADRYQSARELEDDLARFQTGRPIRARRATPFERAWKWAQRNQVTAGLAVATVLLTLLGLPTMAWLRAKADSAQTEAKLERIEREKADELVAVETAKVAAITKAKRDADYAFLVRDIETKIYLRRHNEARILMAKAQVEKPSALLDANQRNRIDWEWSYLDKKLDSSSLAFQAHPSKVECIAVSLDDSKMATVGESGMDPSTGEFFYGDVAIWDLSSGELLHRLTGEEGFTGCDFSPDGSQLATISLHNLSEFDLQGYVRMWEVSSGKLIHTIKLTEEHKAELLDQKLGQRRQFVPKVQFDETGKFLVTCSPLITYRTDTWEKLWQKPGYLACIRPGTSTLLSLGPPLLLQDIETGEEESKSQGWWQHGFGFSDDGKKFLTYQRNGAQVLEWTFEDSKVRWAKPVDIKPSNCVLITPDGNGYIRADTNGDLQRFELGKPIGEPSKQFLGHVNDVREVLFTHDSKKLVAAAVDGWVRVWDLEESQEKKFYAERYKNYEPVEDISFNRAGTKLYYAKSSYNLTSETGRGASGWFELDGAKSEHREIQTTNCITWPRYEFSYSPSGDFLVAPAREAERPPEVEIRSFAKSGNLNIFSAETGEVLDTVALGEGYISSVCWRPDQKQIAVATFVFDVETESGDTKVATFSVDDKGKREGEIQWHNIADTPEPLSLCYPPSGEQLLCHMSTGVLQLDLVRSTDQESVGPEAEGHVEQLWAWDQPRFGHVSLDVNPSGTRLAIAYFGQPVSPPVVRVYDLKSRELLMKLDAPRSVCSVKFSPNGRRLAFVGYDNIIHLCDSESGYRLITLNGQSDVHKANAGFSPRVIFSNDGRLIATNALGRLITVWESTPATK